jgi:hypothetical protein
MEKSKKASDTTAVRRCVSAFVSVLLLQSGCCAHDPVYRDDPDPVYRDDPDPLSKLQRIMSGSRERLTIAERNAIVAWADIWFENGKLPD